MSQVYASAAPRYRASGWPGVLPLPARKKKFPPKGFTGADGADPTDLQIEAWINGKSNGNIAIRVPPGVVGYDADLYKAAGQKTHAGLVAKCGELPATWVSTSRTDGSGIRFYRIPEGVKLRGALGGIEIIQWHHRYAVVAPSIHPDTDRPYRLISPDGEIVEILPHPSELPDLPAAWLEELREPEPSPNGDRPPRRTATGEWSRHVKDAYGDALAGLVKGSRHDTALAAALQLARYEDLGYPGAADALESLGRTFRADIADRARPADADKEWADIVESARARVASSPAAAPRWEDTREARQRVEAEFCDMASTASRNGSGPDGDAPPDAPAPASPVLLPPPSEPMAVARAIVEMKWRCPQHRLVLRHWRGTFQRWEATHWAEREEGAVRSELYKVLEHAVYQTMKKDGIYEAPWAPSRRKVADVVDALRAVAFLPETVEQPAWLDGASGPPAGELVAVRNGLLHVPTRLLHDHDARFFNRVAVPFDHDPNAPAPARWLKFLGDLWPDDPESIAALAEFFGYILSGETSLQKILLLVGPTRAGKGVIARVLTALLGRQHVAGPTLASLGQNFGLSPLIGKPLAVISDARLNGTGTYAVVERLLSISGEDTLTVDRKYREPWTGRLSTRLLVISNELPQFGDSSRAIARRFIVLLLQRSWLGQEDPRLTDELLGELPGILNWALDGLERLRAQGRFTEPASSKEAVVALEDLASPVAAFVRDRCDRGPARQVAVDGLYRAWRTWCEEQGETKPGTAQVFGRDLRAVVPGLRIRRPREDEGGRQRHYQGIALREPH